MKKKRYATEFTTFIHVENSTLKYVIWWKNGSRKAEYCGSGQRCKIQGKFYHNQSKHSAY